MAEGVKLVRHSKASMPVLKVPKTVMHNLGKQMERGILDNIVTQRQADGTPIKRNNELYADTKRRKRWVLQGQVKSLVAEMQRFVKPLEKSWRIMLRKREQAIYIVPATSELKRLSLWVQQKGYLGWFGISRKTVRALRGVMREWIRAEFLKAANKKAKG